MMTNQPSKSYEKIEFLNSSDARSIRVLCELIEPHSKLKQKKVTSTIVFFGSVRSKEKKIAIQDLAELEKKMRAENRSKPQLEHELQKAKRLVKLSEYYDKALSLSRKLSAWGSVSNPEKHHICSGGGPGMMEAANRGAHEMRCNSIAYGISLPFEQGINEFASEELSFEFHYFFIRKFYFLYHAKAVVVFPGGFGTMDELFETLTLIQTKKLNKRMPIYLFGKEFWDGLINFDHLIEWGVISVQDIDLFRIVNDVEEAYELIIDDLTNEVRS